MSELHAISDPGPARAADLIFVHGLGGDAFATWWHDADKPRNSWPFWLAEDFPQVAVHCLAYDASPSKWLGSSMPLVDRATNLLTLFEARAIGERALFFVCHSLGGLVAKQMLRSALELGEDAWQKIAKNTRGIVFLATPHTGARLADYLGALGKILRLTVSVSELEASAPTLRDLNVWYRQNAKDLGIDTLAMFETRDTHGVRVVDETSADAGLGVPRAIDADHFSICKPQGRTELVYGAITNFLSKRLLQNRRSPVPDSRGEPSATPESCPASPYFISYSRRSEADGKLANDLRAALESAGQEGVRSYFISYTAHSVDDAVLAKELTNMLETAGHEVFIDAKIGIGRRWSDEIERHLIRCTHFIVLLSTESINRNAVIEEVRRAAARQPTPPVIMPIAMNFRGRLPSLPYQLAIHIKSLQTMEWNGPADTPRIIAGLLSVGSPEEAPAKPGSGNRTIEPSWPPTDVVALLRRAGVQPVEAGVVPMSFIKAVAQACTDRSEAAMVVGQAEEWLKEAGPIEGVLLVLEPNFLPDIRVSGALDYWLQAFSRATSRRFRVLVALLAALPPAVTAGHRDVILRIIGTVDPSLLGS